MNTSNIFKNIVKCYILAVIASLAFFYVGHNFLSDILSTNVSFLACLIGIIIVSYSIFDMDPSIGLIFGVIFSGIFKLSFDFIVPIVFGLSAEVANFYFGGAYSLWSYFLVVLIPLIYTGYLKNKSLDMERNYEYLDNASEYELKQVIMEGFNKICVQGIKDDETKVKTIHALNVLEKRNANILFMVDGVHMCDISTIRGNIRLGMSASYLNIMEKR